MARTASYHRNVSELSGSCLYRYSGKLWLVQIAEVHVDALRKELEGEGVRGRGIDQDFKGRP